MDGSTDAIGATELFGRPDLFLHRLDLATGELELWPATRDDYRRSAFLDERMASSSRIGYTLPLAAVLGLGDALPLPQGRLRYVFHGAFCCSTLVARALELPGTSFALKEPAVYLTLAELRRRGGPPGPSWSAVLDVVQAFVGRCWEPHERVVVKPSDSCNNLILPLLEREPVARALLLSSSLSEFLLSVLKSPGRRAWTHERLAAAVHDARELGVLGTVEPAALDDAARAAYLWLVQQHVFLHAVRRLGPTRVRTLDCAVLLADPGAAMSRLAGFFELELSQAQLGAAVAECFTAHAKAPTTRARARPIRLRPATNTPASSATASRGQRASARAWCPGPPGRRRCEPLAAARSLSSSWRGSPPRPCASRRRHRAPPRTSGGSAARSGPRRSRPGARVRSPAR
jgi:hypothetical protein